MRFMRTARYSLAVCIAPRSKQLSVQRLGYGMDERGSFPGEGDNVISFSLRHRIKTGSGPPQPPIQRIPGDLTPGAKRPGREADHSPPTSADNAIPSLPKYVFIAWYLLKYRDNFTFTFTIVTSNRIYRMQRK
jgi:hypothetical protein